LLKPERRSSGAQALHNSPGFRKVLEDAANLASSTALRMQKEGFENFSKAGSYSTEELFTSADVEAQRLVVEILTAKYPQIPIVAEEQTKPEIKTDKFFTIDPIDGTLAFASGGNGWGCMIGYIERGQPSAGVLSSPAKHGTAYASLGGGCYLDYKKVTLEKNAELKSLVIPYGPWTPDIIKEKVLPAFEKQGVAIIRADSALDGVFRLLKGEASLYIGCAERIWDVAAAAILVREAGGVICSSDGSDHSWSKIEVPSLMGVSREHIELVLTHLKD